MLQNHAVRHCVDLRIRRACSYSAWSSVLLMYVELLKKANLKRTSRHSTCTYSHAYTNNYTNKFKNTYIYTYTNTESHWNKCVCLRVSMYLGMCACCAVQRVVVCPVHWNFSTMFHERIFVSLKLISLKNIFRKNTELTDINYIQNKRSVTVIIFAAMVILAKSQNDPRQLFLPISSAFQVISPTARKLFKCERKIHHLVGAQLG